MQPTVCLSDLIFNIHTYSYVCEYLPRTSSSMMTPTDVDCSAPTEISSRIKSLIFIIPINVSFSSCIRSSVMLTVTDTLVSPGRKVKV